MGVSDSTLKLVFPHRFFSISDPVPVILSTMDFDEIIIPDDVLIPSVALIS
jgi:hypothetical protein